jgi:hypothetical protein
MSAPTILISPLNWGFGHAGRMIPLALELKRRGCEIVFGADPQLLPLVEKELPGIRLIEIRGMRIRYSRILPQYVSIFLQLPLIVFSSIRENHSLRHLAQEIKPSVIISDNRFGFFHRDIFSVYVTHQLRIPFPPALRFMEPFAAWLHGMVIKRYHLCLVPDYPGHVNLSGRLSHDIKPAGNVHYMGPLSRFRIEGEDEKRITPQQSQYCLILSGPEPQRSILMEKVKEALQGRQLFIMSAEPVKESEETGDEVTFFIRPDPMTMKNIIAESTRVIARSGYTSVMELTSLGKGAILIPTPGQPEQEYLGRYLHGRYGFITLTQNKISNIESLPAGYTDNESPSLPDANPLLEKAIELLLEHNKERQCHHSHSCKEPGPYFCR